MPNLSKSSYSSALICMHYYSIKHKMIVDILLILLSISVIFLSAKSILFNAFKLIFYKSDFSLWFDFNIF